MIDLVVGDGGVAAQHEPERQAGEVGRRRAGDAEDGAGLLVAAAFDLVPVAAGQHRRRRHGVHRQRAGLVAVDHRRAAERLDVGERLDHRLGLGQRCAPDDSISCTNVGRPVGMAEIAVDTHSSTSVSVSWPRSDAEDGDDGHRRPGEDAEQLGQAVELPLQRRLRALRRRDHVGDVTHLGRCAGGDHDHDRRAPGHLGVLEDQVRPVAERRLALGEASWRPWRSARSRR